METKHNYYHSTSSNTDLQKMRDEAQQRLDKHGEESVVHHHKQHEQCDSYKHYNFFSTEGYE